jgi:hypothetical protein
VGAQAVTFGANTGHATDAGLTAQNGRRQGAQRVHTSSRIIDASRVAPITVQRTAPKEL